MKKFFLGFAAIVMAFAFTTREAVSSNYYFTNGSTWTGASSLQDARDQTGCDETKVVFCVNVYSRSKLIMSGDTVIDIAQDPNNPGNPYPPDAILKEQE